VGANSQLRRALKRGLVGRLPQHRYRQLQGLAMAWDIRTGRWREPELDVAAAAAEPGSTVLDVGANFGLYSYHLSRAVGEGGRVYAFEIVPATVETLRFVHRVLRLGNVEIVPYGCSDAAGTVSVTMPLQESGAMSTGQAHFAQRDDERTGKEQHVRSETSVELTCEVVAIDEFLPPVENLSFMKLDIEGAELFALRGAERLVAEHKPTVVCEVNPWFLEGFGQDVDALVGFFADRGYAVYRCDEESSAPRLVPVSRPEIVEDNYVFVHPQRQGALERLVSTRAN
jgi:FkbM family methyltransferase